MTVTESYTRLTQLNIKQDALFRESLQCAEHGLYRSAHVGAWAAFMDYCHEWLYAHPGRLATIQGNYPTWKIVAAADFREQKDHILLEVMRKQGFISNGTMKALHGLLKQRNECAHPEDHSHGINETLGYLEELMQRIAALETKR